MRITRNKMAKEEREKIILDFMDAVYEGNGSLALSSFDEMKVLKDATEKIRSALSVPDDAGEAFEVDCPACHGERGYFQQTGENEYPFIPCSRCQGKGTLTVVEVRK